MSFVFFRSRKLNTQLENAIQEAMAELDRMSEKQLSSPEQSEKNNEEKSQPQKHCKAAMTVGRLRSSHR